MKHLFRQVAIVGLGLIGGSLGMALRRGRLAGKVIGFTRREATLRKARARGAVDDGCTEFCPDWLGASDLVVIATPPLSVVPVARRIGRMTRHSFILTDVASTKGRIVRQMERMLPDRIRFVGSHPMAGSERSGVEAANPKLFERAACLLTPTPRTSREALAKVSSLWRAVGGRVLLLRPARHDALVAQISHMPHLAAAALALSAEGRALPLAAGGFADTTRLALSDPSLWSEICLTNRREILAALSRFDRQMSGLRRLLLRGAGADLSRRLRAAQRKRRQVKR
ncbi:MAG: prephenate dehydrogenase/arogenate dehydrogenase family protein [Candidatus Omnitrophica bacterium]|nr:prephenate dehydrogenase/arogenate dehydrogenase family protein [Candidatus Omnitrophota bacterium]